MISRAVVFGIVIIAFVQGGWATTFMEPLKGEPVVVASGDVGILSPVAGTIKQAEIPPYQIAQVEKGSEVTKEQPGSAPAALAADSSAAQKPDSAASAASPVPTAATPAPMSPAPASGQGQAQKSARDAPVGPGSGSPIATAQSPSTETEKTAPPSKKEPSGKEGSGVSWEISAYSVTVNGTQWTRLAISPEIPIWKFGIGLDFECFLDEKGEFNQKGWLFDKDSWQTSLIRKIKYLRFGHEYDPFFAKVGGLSNVTLGYGFIVDRFTNLLHYPDQKLLGVQVYLNDIGPIGLTLQTMVPDIQEFKDNGGIFAGRLAVCPLKPMNIPLLSELFIGATYGIDLNQFSPARSWSFPGKLSDKNGNGLTDWDYALKNAQNAADSDNVRRMIALKNIDSTSIVYEKPDTTYRDSVNRYALLGGDIGMPIIKTDLLGLDIYAQGGVVADTNMASSKRRGWGFGAPGAKLTVGPIVAQAEYRHVHGKFTPGYFNPYYLDLRLQRHPSPLTRSESLDSIDLDGIYGCVGANIFNLLFIDASYQYMAGSGDALDQRFEARGNLGDAIIKRIPKISKLEAYFYKTNINRTIVVYNPNGTLPHRNNKDIIIKDDFLEQTPTLFWGYRVGVEITKGASLIWDQRYGYQWSETNRLVPNNNITIGTAITF